MTQNKGKTSSVLIGLSGALLLAGAGGLAAYFSQVKDATASSASPVAVVGPQEVDNQKVDKGATKAPNKAVPKGQASLEGAVALSLGANKLSVSRAELGASKAKDGSISVDRDRMLATLQALKLELDQGATDAYLDLENQKVVPAAAGYGLEPFGSLALVEAALRRGDAEVELVGAVLEPEVTIEDLGISDISTVIGSFSTKFSVAEKTRNANLKLLASKIDGLVLQPGQTFSFNERTGMRTLEDGFKMAHVIQAGEMVDGMAGGSCQISTTLHGAAFFSGLDIVKSTPHSRPSTYVTLGLDSTVVAGRVDLQLRNPYDFPIAIHYRVRRGLSEVRILGKEKPFDEIEFERNIDQRIDFETVTREDMGMGVGHMVVDQAGYPGYKVTKIRRTYKDGEVIKTDKWKIRYSPVVEYARLGINPDPNLPAPKKRKAHGPKPASGRFSMRQ